MAQNLTTGIVQVLDNSTESINAALAQVLEQLDHLRGLRGRTEIHAETGVSSPTQGSSAARLDNLQELVSDPSDPFAAAQRFQAGQEETTVLGDLDEALLALLTAHPGAEAEPFLMDLDAALLAALTPRGGPTATQVYYAEGFETMNAWAALQQLGMV
jgi:hypothetical protein